MQLARTYLPWAAQTLLEAVNVADSCCWGSWPDVFPLHLPKALLAPGSVFDLRQVFSKAVLSCHLAQEILIIIRNSEKYIELRFSGCFPYRLLYCWPEKNWHRFPLKKKIFCSWKHEFFRIIGKLSSLFINILFMHLRCCDKLTGFVLYFPTVYFK